MSYCRWSSDDWRCDVYCYADCTGGYTTHVAGNRVVGRIPEVPDIMSTDAETFTKAHRKQLDFISTAKRKTIGGPFDGESFNDPTLEAFEERLHEIKAAGYNVPDWVFKRITEEREAEDGNA